MLQLSRTSGVRQSALAVALGIEPPTVHRTVGRLEAAGFVERRPDPDDARASLTLLTARGEQACVEIDRIWHEADRWIAETLTPREATELQRLLTAVAARTTA